MTCRRHSTRLRRGGRRCHSDPRSQVRSGGNSDFRGSVRQPASDRGYAGGECGRQLTPGSWPRCRGLAGILPTCEPRVAAGTARSDRSLSRHNRRQADVLHPSQATRARRSSPSPRGRAAATRPVKIDRVPVNDGSRYGIHTCHHAGCGFDFRLLSVRSLFTATRPAAASAARAHLTNSSGSSSSRSGARQKERSMAQPFFS